MDLKTIDQKVTEDYAIYNGDCVEVIQAIPDESIDYSVYSPPFQSLYVFSDSDRDMSNCASKDQFWDHYKFLIKEKLRVTKSGRLSSVHCMNLLLTKSHDGVIGVDDFRGNVIRAHQDAGWILHSEVVIWKDPVVAMQRSKSIGLLHKQIKKDSAMSRMALPDYVVTFRKPGENQEPISGGFNINEYAGSSYFEPAWKTMTDDNGNTKDRSQDEIDNWNSVEVWQRYASPVWFDIRQGNVLNKAEGRHEDDVKHITPLQLDVIDRCLQLWSLPGEKILTPFLGIGSEAYTAIKKNRKAIGIELKKSYFDLAVKNLQSAVNENKQMELF